MASAYTPGLLVSKRTTVTKLRELPLPGRTLVEKGARVDATTPVLTANLPGELSIVRVADRIGLDPEDVVPEMRVAVGDEISKDQLLCECKTFFGLMTAKLESPLSGTVEFFTEANAHLGVRQAPIPLTVHAYISGTVTDVEEGKNISIETEASFMQGIFGVGGERLGEILPLPLPNNATVDAAQLEQLNVTLKNKIVIGGARFTIDALRKACADGASAIVTGSIDATTLRDYVGYDIGVSVTGDEEVPCTVIITEGFGMLPISDRITTIVQSLSGQLASVSGATQVRAGAMRPEIIVPLATGNQGARDKNAQPASTLEIGSHVRIIRVPYFGQLGEVVDLPSEPHAIPSGAKVRVLKARLENGEEVIVPRANVELTQGH